MLYLEMSFLNHISRFLISVGIVFAVKVVSLLRDIEKNHGSALVIGARLFKTK